MPAWGPSPHLGGQGHMHPARVRAHACSAAVTARSVPRGAHRQGTLGFQLPAAEGASEGTSDRSRDEEAGAAGTGDRARPGREGTTT